MTLTLRDKIAHLHRRFGMGATLQEVDDGEKAGLDATLKRLIDYDDQPAAPGHPYEFNWREKEEADLGMWRYRCWWVYQMLATKRPLQERLALFWHDHFAVADSKVEDGPMMLSYLQTLRKHAAGDFGTLLGKVSKEPAMMRYLDMDRAIRGRPNENFAREVMELFTLGIGNYSERDVKELARAFTGWGFMNLYWEMPGNATTKLRNALRDGHQFSSFVLLPGFRDVGPKTILGKTDDFDGDSALRHLAEHPATARYLSRKLWEYFVYANPEPAIVERLAKVFGESRGQIRPVLYAIARSPEFWSEKAVRQQVKSPVDFVIPIARQMGMGEYLPSLREKTATPETRIPQRVMDETGYLAWLMERMGMSLLNPPDVSGWDWGTAWISTESMVVRLGFRGNALWGEGGLGEGGKRAIAQVKAQAPKDTPTLVDALCRVYDVQPAPETRKVVEHILGAFGGVKLLEKPEHSVGLLDGFLKMTIASPEFQLA